MLEKKKGGWTKITDKRGKHQSRPNKLPDASKTKVKNPTEGFPTKPSHYCRMKSTRQYLSDLSQAVQGKMCN